MFISSIVRNYEAGSLLQLENILNYKTAHSRKKMKNLKNNALLFCITIATCWQTTMDISENCILPFIPFFFFSAKHCH